MMTRQLFIAILVISFFVPGCSGKVKHESGDSPYAGQQNREIKALSAKEIKGFREGHGMGLAKVAELNNYPGPKHIMELSGQLELTEEQEKKVTQVFRTMKSRAQSLGNRLIKKEKQLDEMFANEHTSKSKVKGILQEIGKLKADIRFAHIQAHLEMKSVLTPEQIKKYDNLRGYGKAGNNHKNHGQHHSM